ncbi:hypothetical protein PARPLA_01750 [Rhodobacteraceae bacterium THAF1]|nr:hypothetical protein FIU81_10555 [Palleronia sp. THAF1]VDC24077.1 hypothetical protein PARPLA_01750 [Rhodobacteraceae bacterium THAF1]
MGGGLPAHVRLMAHIAQIGSRSGSYITRNLIISRMFGHVTS